MTEQLECPGLAWVLTLSVLILSIDNEMWSWHLSGCFLFIWNVCVFVGISIICVGFVEEEEQSSLVSV